MPSVRASAKPAQSPEAPAPSVPEESSTFDASYAKTVVGYIVEDIASA